MAVHVHQLEITKFKSIVNRLELVNLSVDNNILLIPFDCECETIQLNLLQSVILCVSIFHPVSDDLIEAFGYALGKDVVIDDLDGVDVSIEVQRDDAENKKLRRRAIYRDHRLDDEYYEYEMNEAQVSWTSKNEFRWEWFRSIPFRLAENYEIGLHARTAIGR